MDTAISIRTNRQLLNKAKKVFSAMGMSTSAGINMFLSRVAAEHGLPFTPTHPKAIRARWEKQTISALKSGGRFSTAKTLHKSILVK